jgi:hypothetical protein
VVSRKDENHNGTARTLTPEMTLLNTPVTVSVADHARTPAAAPTAAETPSFGSIVFVDLLFLLLLL